MIDLVRLGKEIGANISFGLKEGDVFMHPLNYEIKTEITTVFKDILNNDSVFTKYADSHIREQIMHRAKDRIFREYGLNNLQNILAAPDVVLNDKNQQAIMYCKRFESRYVAVVVGKNSRYIYTIQPIPLNFSLDRYIIIYEGK
ncbi:hypothetical protein [Candidatus Magnetomonas plexicatena]|uniref:hypothetical protein n=1 Tax=Candidatus Magnetomonas plexicatena TaxID=2552947 RepID=UPI001C76B393|nr:hypothetical protein E2O03_010595 [Nitrospirales bacterium LBB_01]